MITPLMMRHVLNDVDEPDVRLAVVQAHPDRVLRLGSSGASSASSGGRGTGRLAGSRPRATPSTGASVKTRDLASRPTIGRVKNQATTTSRIVESPRKKAKPRTGPTVSTHSRKAPMKLEMSAARIVRNAR